MKTAWWPAFVNCQKCNGETTLQLANFSADGEIMFVFFCPKCEELVHWRVFASALAFKALMQDMERAEKPKPLAPRTPLKPPLQLPHVPEHLTPEDMQWMKAMHLDAEGGELQ